MKIKKINKIIDYGLFIALIIVVIIATIMALIPQIKMYLNKSFPSEITEIKKDKNE